MRQIIQFGKLTFTLIQLQLVFTFIFYYYQRSFIFYNRQYRRQCLYSIAADLNQELDFVDQFSDDNPKNYQIWFHRRAIVDTMHNASREIVFCDRVLAADAKNYHCWAHRQYIVKKYNIWEDELSRTDTLIKADARNNSAWNHRWFVLTQGPINFTSRPELLDREVQYTHSHIQDIQLNESAWNYLRGLAESFSILVEPIQKMYVIDCLFMRYYIILYI